MNEEASLASRAGDRIHSDLDVRNFADADKARRVRSGKNVRDQG